ncbi:hypothetical protein D3C85_1817020 [compost metagenome]
MTRVPDVATAMVDAATVEHNAAAAKLILQMADMLTDRVDVTTTDVASLDRDELARRLAEFQGRKAEE